MTPNKRQQTGVVGEDAAAKLLAGKGMRIIARNWRHRSLELDIVAEEGDTLVFVEVKTRAATGRQQPHEALTPAKRTALTKAAAHYLGEHDLWHRPCRFDLVSVFMHANTPVAEHIPHAFELSLPAHRRDTAWQPW